MVKTLAVGATLLAAVGLALSAHPARATEVGRSRNLGLGFGLGSPSAIVGKYYVHPGEAWDFGLGFWSGNYGCGRYGCGGSSAVSLHGDYLWQEPITHSGPVKLDWHLGVGGRVWTGDAEFAVAARMPVGLDMMFRRPHFVELFVELAPALYIVPGVGMTVEGMLGVRFYP